MPKLKELELNLFQWGYFNVRITSQSIIKLTQAISELSSLEVIKIDMGRWGCEQYRNLNIYDDSTIQGFCKMIKALAGTLKEIYINLRSWAYENEYINNQSVRNIFQSIGKCEKLESLILDMNKWGYLNEKINNESVSDMPEYFKNLSNLKSVQINMNLWRLFDDFQTVKSAFAQLPNLLQIKIFTENPDCNIISLEELVKFKYQSYLTIIAMLKTQKITDQIRKEIVWDSIRCIKFIFYNPEINSSNFKYVHQYSPMKDKDSFGISIDNHKQIIYSCGTDHICLWDIEKQQILRRIQEPKINGESQGLSTIEFDPQQRVFVASGISKMVHIFDERQNHKIIILQGHTENVTRIKSFTNNTQYFLATGSHDKSLCLWNIRKLTAYTKIPNYHNSTIFGIDLNIKQQILYTSSWDKNLKILDLNNLKVIETIEEAQKERMIACIYDNRTNQLMTSSADGTLQIYKQYQPEQIQ
ncbi:hypothetical protein IMG5_098510 [Ichthyophthirius multifiliis]|uniref:Uncharacterized protein n=1 Tax=Ichthyophthirius multifiliis TaxID=5932 RepID=G0QRY5_ICHMU|nr:hypothetical protein IMG5_098510 [Ichthyophthirius multifiliis]EGR32015.1 hypothetical protein IMG5_098510 [Ichthyophthirius multifiliis]|eukprot:XP_004035501.1 hypothetical protein IMG5_098510 [Ichthyophthirius multifiliis]